MTFFLVLSSWALLSSIAPVTINIMILMILIKMILHHDQWSSKPDSSHREELPSLGSIWENFQVGALAEEPVVMSEDPTVQIFFLAVVFISCIFTLDMVVTQEPIIEYDYTYDIRLCEICLVFFLEFDRYLI